MPIATSRPKLLPAGIYSPTVTFFQATREQDLDLETHAKHMEFLARAGLHGVVVQGSTAEAVALSRTERQEMVRVAKEAFQRVGNPGAIIAGTVGAQSTREAIEMCCEAASAGADFALILPPSYYPTWMTPDAIQGFFEDVADASPIPVIIYSYPGVCSGINMDTDLILRLAKHPNICGIKHTDHDVGKIAREAASITTPFTILGGATDYLLGTLVVGGKGAITGIANVAPRCCARAYELFQAGRTAEALEFAAEISKAEWGMGKTAILGTKWIIAKANGYGDDAALGRKPLPVIPQASKEYVEDAFEKIIALERKLEKDGYVGLGLRTGEAPVKKANVGVNGANGEQHGLLDKVKQAIA